MEPSDVALVLACRNQDQDAWEQLVRRYQRLVYSIPRRAGLGDDAAADVFQRTFALLVEHIDRLAQPERVGAWLATTARRESWRVSRNERRDVPLPTPSADEEQPTDIRDQELLPDEQVARIEQQLLVRSALQTLDERCRMLLEMLFFRQTPPPYNEIASTLGTTEGSIGPTRARCFAKLRQQLASTGFDLA